MIKSSDFMPKNSQLIQERHQKEFRVEQSENSRHKQTMLANLVRDYKHLGPSQFALVHGYDTPEQAYHNNVEDLKYLRGRSNFKQNKTFRQLASVSEVNRHDIYYKKRGYALISLNRHIECENRVFSDRQNTVDSMSDLASHQINHTLSKFNFVQDKPMSTKLDLTSSSHLPYHIKKQTSFGKDGICSMRLDAGFYYLDNKTVLNELNTTFNAIMKTAHDRYDINSHATTVYAALLGASASILVGCLLGGAYCKNRKTNKPQHKESALSDDCRSDLAEKGSDDQAQAYVALDDDEQQAFNQSNNSMFGRDLGMGPMFFNYASNVFQYEQQGIELPESNNSVLFGKG